MKVTAIIPEELLEEVQKYSGGKNITDSIIRALKDWLYMKRIKSLNEDLSRNPLCFHDRFKIEELRKDQNSL